MHSTEYQQAFWCSLSWDSQIVNGKKEKEKNTHWHFSIETFFFALTLQPAQKALNHFGK